MRRSILTYPDSWPEIAVDYGGTVIHVSETAAITITENCGTCDWCVKGSAGRRLSCGNTRIKAARPYVDNLNGNTCAVEADTMPEWCPLKLKEVK